LTLLFRAITVPVRLRASVAATSGMALANSSIDAVFIY
jgi:hypothetical protein